MTKPTTIPLLCSDRRCLTHPEHGRASRLAVPVKCKAAWVVRASGLQCANRVLGERVARRMREAQ